MNNCNGTHVFVLAYVVFVLLISVTFDDDDPMGVDAVDPLETTYQFFEETLEEISR